MRRAGWLTLVLALGCGGSSEPSGGAVSPAGSPSSAEGAAEGAKATTPPSPKSKGQASAPEAGLPEAALLEPIGERPPEGPPVRVTLPPAPDLSPAKVPNRYPDGSFSIAGLRQDLDASVRDGDAGKEVVVKAWVTKIYVPPECREGEVCPPAKQPHVWVTDTAEERGLAHALLVANYHFPIPEWEAERWEGEPDVVLEVGKRYAFKGKLRLFSDTGFAHQEGLLEFVAVRDLDATGAETGDWILPPGAPWHPKELARQEEENRQLMERMAKSR